jgi:hypothetical protein
MKKTGLLTLLILISSLMPLDLNAQITFTKRGKAVKAIKSGNVKELSTIMCANEINTNKGIMNKNTLLGEIINANITEEKKIEMLNILSNSSNDFNPNQPLILNGQYVSPIVAAINILELDLASNLIDAGSNVDVWTNKMNLWASNIIPNATPYRIMERTNPLISAIHVLDFIESDNHITEGKVLELIRKILYSFPESISNATEEFKSYTEEAINVCINEAWDDVLYEILATELTTEETIINTLEKVLASDHTDKMKSELIKPILHVMNMRDMDINNIEINANVIKPEQEVMPIKETPLVAAARAEQTNVYKTLVNAGAIPEEQHVVYNGKFDEDPYRKKVSITSIAEAYNANDVFQLATSVISLDKALQMLKTYNYGFDSKNFNEQIDAAISKMVIVGEYRITERELTLFFGPRNEFGTRTGGIFNYSSDNPAIWNNWIYVSLIGCLCFQDKEIVKNRDISTTIYNGFIKTGLINISSHVILNELKRDNLVIPGSERQFRSALEFIIKEGRSISTGRAPIRY